MSEISTKPYLIRAIHEWCSDTGYTPYLAVMVDEHTLVPRGYVKGGEIVLNVSSLATNRLRLGNDLIEFEARFGGVAQQISVPVENVSAIYARENGHGMAFEVVKPPAVPEGPTEAAPTGIEGADAAASPVADRSAEGDAAGPAGRGGQADEVAARSGAPEGGADADAQPAPSRRAPSRARRGLSLASGGRGDDSASTQAPATGSEKPASGGRKKPLAEAGRGKDAGEEPGSGKGGTDGGDGDDGGGPPSRGKPRLTRIK